MFKHTVKHKVDLPCYQRSRSLGRTAACRASPSLSVPPLSLQLYPRLYLLHRHPRPVSGETKAQMDVRGETRAKAKEGTDVPQTWFVGPFLSLPEVCQVLNHLGVTVCNCVSDDPHSNMTWFHFSFHDTICHHLHYFCGGKDRQKVSKLSEAVCP